MASRLTPAVQLWVRHAAGAQYPRIVLEIIVIDIIAKRKSWRQGLITRHETSYSSTHSVPNYDFGGWKRVIPSEGVTMWLSDGNLRTLVTSAVPIMSTLFHRISFPSIIGGS